MNTDHSSKITSVLQAGQFALAEQLCREALPQQPADETLLVLLALSLQYQQRQPEALAIYAELTRHFPTSSLHWNNFGTALLDSGLPDDAYAAYTKAVELDPANALAKDQLGMLMIERRDYLAARHMLLDAFELDQQSLEIRIHAAKACCLCQDVVGAGDLLKPWRHWTPLNNDDLQLELAQILTMRNDVPDAAELLTDLVGRRPTNLKARLLLASILERQNLLGEAESMVLPIIGEAGGAKGVERNEADHLMATLALRRKEPARARQILESCGPQDEGDAAHFFQLAAACDKLGDSKATIQALTEAHRLDVAQRRFDSPEYFAPGSPAMPMDAPKVSVEQYSLWPQLIAPEARDSPIFVVGFPRSGTTLLEQMLDAHPLLQSMDENPFFNRLAQTLRGHDPRILEDLGVLRQYDCDELRKSYHAMVAERIPRRADTRLIDKNPLNMHWLPMIHRLFPEARFILALRHPCDVILSCYMQNFRASALAAACSTLERLARAYVQTMSLWIDQAAILKPSIMLSRYEDLVENPPQQVTTIAQFLELDDPSPMLQFDRHARNKAYIGTPSYSQVIEPVNRKGLGRWHNYRGHLEPVLPILEPMLRHWGYSSGAHD